MEKVMESHRISKAQTSTIPEVDIPLHYSVREKQARRARRAKHEGVGHPASPPPPPP